jgi:hypothetical protein
MHTYLVCTREELAKYPSEQYGWVVNASTADLAIADARREYKPTADLVAVELTDENGAYYGVPD